MKASTHTKIAAVTILLVLLMAAAVQAYSSCRPPPEPTKQPWKSGATTVTLSHDGILRVTGKGAMEDYRYDRFHCGTQSPWSNALWHHRHELKITDVIIEEGVTYIGHLAFAGLRNLNSVTIPASVTSIGEEAFSRLSSITVAADNAHYSSEDGVLFNKDKTTLILYPIKKQQDAYTIPDGVTNIGDSAFFRSDLKSITIPAGVISIGNAAFAYCVNLISITIPNSVTSIGDGAFEYCKGLMSVVIGDGVKSISRGMFDNCISLTSITIPDGVTEIGPRAFLECYNLSSITIPSSVVSIGELAFGLCFNLTSIIVKNPNPPELDVNEPQSVFDRINWDSACLYVPKGSMDAYRSADGWKDFDCIKPIVSDDIEGTPWLTQTILTALLLSAVIFIIIKKSGKR